MATLSELREVRIEKLKKLEAAGMDPFPRDVVKTHTCKEVIEQFTELESSQAQSL